jgi:hypothetical protein
MWWVILLIVIGALLLVVCVIGLVCFVTNRRTGAKVRLMRLCLRFQRDRA